MAHLERDLAELAREPEWPAEEETVAELERWAAGLFRAWAAFFRSTKGGHSRHHRSGDFLVRPGPLHHRTSTFLRCSRQIRYDATQGK